MATSRVPALINAVLAALRSAPGLSGVQVVDGPLVTASAAQEWVFVGYDGDPEGDFTTAETEQTWAGLGARAKSESISLTCCVLVQRGSAEVSTCRDRTYAIFGSVEDVLRSDPSLGLPSPTTTQVASDSFHTEQTSNGVQGRLTFAVTCTTRI